MSYVVSVVCVDPAADVKVPSGDLVVEEAVQVRYHAGYLAGLSQHLGHSVSGRAYYVYAPDEDGYLSSRALFYDSQQDSEPPRLAVGREAKTQFDELLRNSVAASGVGKALVLCEFNGNVTWSDPRPQELGDLTVQVVGPVSTDEFWALEQEGRIIEPSITIIEELCGSG